MNPFLRKIKKLTIITAFSLLSAASLFADSYNYTFTKIRWTNAVKNIREVYPELLPDAVKTFFECGESQDYSKIDSIMPQLIAANKLKKDVALQKYVFFYGFGSGTTKYAAMNAAKEEVCINSARALTFGNNLSYNTPWAKGDLFGTVYPKTNFDDYLIPACILEYQMIRQEKDDDGDTTSERIIYKVSILAAIPVETYQAEIKKINNTVEKNKSSNTKKKKTTSR